MSGGLNAIGRTDLLSVVLRYRETSVLAGIGDFLFVWHLPMFLVLAVGWLVGGAWLLLRSLRKSKYQRRIRLPRCILIFLLAGLGGGASGLVFFYLVNNIGEAIGTNLKYLGVIVATVMFLGVAYLVIYAMLELSMKAALRVAAIPLVAQFVLMGVIGTAGGVPAFYMRYAKLRRNTCELHLNYILSALDEYQQRHEERPAPNLKVLSEKNFMEAKRLECPGAPEREVGFFYYSSRLVGPDEPGQLLVCDFRGNHSGGRNVIMTNGVILWNTGRQFQSLLEEEENKEFAVALRAAEPD